MFNRKSVLRAGMALAAIVVGLGAGTPARSQSGPGTWTMKAPMPGGVRGEVAAVVFNNKLYAIGGNVASNAVPRNEEYDPATDHWRERAPLPKGLSHVGLVGLNHHLINDVVGELALLPTY